MKYLILILFVSIPLTIAAQPMGTVHPIQTQHITIDFEPRQLIRARDLTVILSSDGLKIVALGETWGTSIPPNRVFDIQVTAGISSNHNSIDAPAFEIVGV